MKKNFGWPLLPQVLNLKHDTKLFGKITENHLELSSKEVTNVIDQQQGGFSLGIDPAVATPLLQLLLHSRPLLGVELRQVLRGED